MRPHRRASLTDSRPRCWPRRTARRRPPRAIWSEPGFRSTQDREIRKAGAWHYLCTSSESRGTVVCENSAFSGTVTSRVAILAPIWNRVEYLTDIGSRKLKAGIYLSGRRALEDINADEGRFEVNWIGQGNGACGTENGVNYLCFWHLFSNSKKTVLYELRVHFLLSVTLISPLPSQMQNQAHFTTEYTFLHFASSLVILSSRDYGVWRNGKQIRYRDVPITGGSAAGYLFTSSDSSLLPTTE